MFHSLRRRRYRNAKLLNQRSHIHKAALHPFLLAVGKSLAELSQSHQPRLFFDTQLSFGSVEVLLIRITIIGSDCEPSWAVPLPPLGFSVSISGVIHNFGPELQELAVEKNAASIQKYVQDLANRRNKVLYASSHGMPGAAEIMPFLSYRKAVIFSHFIAYLLVDPHVEHQLFVRQAIDSYLSMLGKLSVRE